MMERRYVHLRNAATCARLGGGGEEQKEEEEGEERMKEIYPPQVYIVDETK
jgi:hypothetical protein